MYNKKGESKMDKTILVVEVIKYNNIPTSYHIKKNAKTLDEAVKYKLSLENLNEAENTTYELFNALGQFQVEEIKELKKVEEVADAITF
jgi:hypothetical protein|tara:strand:+ start:94 stop:360 length:267 start_codon:yes stop_codon:yes gene_type:complete